jgi:hypothetical protein
MNPHRTMSRLAATVLVTVAYFALAAASVGCGGGNDGTTTSTAPVALFTPDTATPAAGTIALLAGASSGASVNVRVTVTGVAGFFGAAFRITYDPTALLFNGMTDSGSFLRADPTDPNVFFLADGTSQTGQVVITATRIFPAVPVSVTTTSDLVVLNFIARKAIGVAAPEGRLDFGDPTQNQVCDGTVAAPGCGAVVVTLPWSGGRVSAQ